jgi:hypothetical protein
MADRNGHFPDIGTNRDCWNFTTEWSGHLGGASARSVLRMIRRALSNPRSWLALPHSSVPRILPLSRARPPPRPAPRCGADFVGSVRRIVSTEQLLKQFI